MTRAGWFVVLGDEDRLVVVFSEIGLPLPAVRFRTAVHAHVIARRHNEGKRDDAEFGTERASA